MSILSNSKSSLRSKDRDVSAEETKPEGAATGAPKYRRILDDLRGAIESGSLKPGDKLQTEAELGRLYQASRITVARAVNELMQQGLVSRRAGSGTHVLPKAEAQGHVFGLLIPDLGRTEIFEPICQGMMRSPLAKSHSLLWGHVGRAPSSIKIKTTSRIVPNILFSSYPENRVARDFWPY